MGIWAKITQFILSFNNRVDNWKPYPSLHMILCRVKEAFYKNEKKKNKPIIGTQASIWEKI